MTTVTTIAFSKLVASDEINAREDSKDGIAELAASIKARGLIQPLCVRPSDGERYQIIDGRRRYRALAALVKEKAWKKADTVPVIIRNEDDAEALATSLIANTQRLPMHPVDQFAVFDRLVAQGRTEAQIASEFALTERVVKQRLALGRLAPEIRKAWKAGKIEEKVARAFTAHPNPDVQRAAFEKLRKQQFAVFDRLVAQGRTEAQIASEFALTERVVKQRLALGRLAPEIRKAWKAGKIEEKVARAFTAHPNPDVQRAAFEKLRKQHGQYLGETSVRAELQGSGRSTSGVPQAAIDRYLAAGGTIAEDLFSAETMAEDGALLATCIGQWAEAETADLRQRLLAQGWSWVVRHKELGVGDWAWRQWPHVIGDDEDPDGLSWEVETEKADAQSAKFTPEQKARSGVVVEFYTNDPTTLHFGLIRPDDQADIEDAIGEADGEDDGEDLPTVSQVIGTDDEAAGEDGPKLSAALLTDLTTAQTEAASQALSAHPRLALRLLLASLLCRSWHAPVKARLEGLASPKVKRDDDFDKTLLGVMRLADGAVDAGLAELIGTALDLRLFNGQTDRGPACLLVDALPGANYLAAMRERFLAGDYFKRSTKQHALDAIDEMREAGVAADIAPEDVLSAMRKTDLAAAAAEAAQRCGWLPPELRHPDYQIPAAPSAAQQKAA